MGEGEETRGLCRLPCGWSQPGEGELESQERPQPHGEGKAMAASVRQERELLGLILGKGKARSSSVWGCAGSRGILRVCPDNF